MLDNPDNEYELLSTQEPHESKIRRSTWPRTIRRLLHRHSGLVLATSLLLFIIAILFFAYDFTFLRNGLSRLSGTVAEKAASNSLISYLWPVGLPGRTDSWENENSKTMRALMNCLTSGNCKENQTSIVLMSSDHFANSISGRVSGEDIWAMSVLYALREMGYSAVFAPNNYELARTYRQYPALVKIIILEGFKAKECFGDPKCIKTPAHPLGIPAWKMLSFHFWGGSSHPLGNSWTLSPENYGIISPGNSRDNVYLGYSIEMTCRSKPVTANEERPQLAYILAKELFYFYSDDYPWKGISFAEPPFDVKLVAGLKDDIDDAADSGRGVPEGLTNLGRLNQTAFYHNLGRSRALIGIGRPELSPSPYDALCMGVPFINPISRWDRDDPDNREKWRTQHDGLKFHNPPYVYNVKKGDITGFWDALKTAMSTPIERYIVPEMTMDALKYRLGIIVENDWRGKAERLLKERLTSGDGKLFEL